MLRAKTKPQTLNPKSQTLNPQPSTLNPQPQVVHTPCEDVVAELRERVSEEAFAIDDTLAGTRTPLNPKP